MAQINLRPFILLAFLLPVAWSQCYKFSCGDVDNSSICAKVDMGSKTVTMNEDGCDKDEECFITAISQWINDSGLPAIEVECEKDDDDDDDD
jgi:hypothetical protein